MNITLLTDRIFKLNPGIDISEVALEVFNYQYKNNKIYSAFCNATGKHPHNVDCIEQIPFLPIEFFKYHKIITGNFVPLLHFCSSGTTGSITSTHYVTSPEIYQRSFLNSFRQFIGEPDEFHILALLPGYLERQESSLVYMVQRLIELSQSEYSGFFLNDLSRLHTTIKEIDTRKILLIGVSFALLDLAENYSLEGQNLIIMETGGMKGRRKEMVREELHKTLMTAFGVKSIYSEYGMTELLSQAYSRGNGIYQSPGWMKILIRETNDPYTFCKPGKTGGINIIDLANIYSCSFIATQDLGKMHNNGNFEISGRFDSSDMRGCNLMVQ